VIRAVGASLSSLILLLWSTNLVAGLWLDRLSRRPPLDGATDARIETPAYADKDEAKRIFRDFYRTENAFSAYDEVRLKPFTSETTNVDAAGLRVTPRASPSATAMVRFFGGSTMWGTGVDDAHTIPALTQAAWPSIHAVNHGQSAFVSLQSVAALTRVIALGEPLGTVVFYDGVNDVFHLCQGAASLDGHAYERFFHRAFELYREEQRGITHSAWTASVGNLVALVVRLSGRYVRRTSDIAEIPPARCRQDPTVLDAIVDVLWRNWSSAKALTEANHGRFIAILQPVSCFGHPERSYLPSTPEWDRWYTLAYERLKKRIATEGRGWAYDMTDVFDRQGPVYIDFAHVTARGNAAIVARIVAVIRGEAR
jgi:hypothetical protein